MASAGSPQITPLKVELVQDVYRAAHNVAELTGILLSDDWTGRDDEFRQALVTCFENMEVVGDAEAARRTFVAAAHASRMTVLLDDIHNIMHAAE